MAGLLDFLQAASNAAASNVSGPVDGLAWLLRKAGLDVGEPVGGSDWMKRQGLTRDVPQSGASLAGETVGLLGPLAGAKAPQVAKGLLQAADNLAAPTYLNKQRGVVDASLSKIGDPRDAAAGLHEAISNNSGQIPYEAIAKMTREEFTKFYDNLAPHHQGKFDRVQRAAAPLYDDLPATMKQYAKDFSYENPRLVRQFSNVQPDDAVTIYRGVTKTDPDAAIKPGDWIALERAYAAQHGRLGRDGSRLMKAKVPAKDIRWAGTSADEYFYVPSSGINQDASSKYEALLHSLGLLGK